MASAFRVTTYTIKASQFTGTTYTLPLNNDLYPDYFIKVHGDAGASGGANNIDNRSVRVDGDPFGNLSGATTSPNEIRLARYDATTEAQITLDVIECVGSQATAGFRLKEVAETTLSATQYVNTTTLAANHTGQTVPFGGHGGGGASHDSANAGAGMSAQGVRLTLTSTNVLTVTREAFSGASRFELKVTTYIVEWGSEWTIQNGSLVIGSGDVGDGTSTTHYITDTITSTPRASTWIWHTASSRSSQTESGYPFCTITLGDGVAQNANETTVAACKGVYQYDTNVEYWTLQHDSLAVDQRFLGVGTPTTFTTQTVDAKVGAETYTSATEHNNTEGVRFAMHHPIITTTGTFGNWLYNPGARLTASTTLTLAWGTGLLPSRSGWSEVVDFEGVGNTTVTGAFLETMVSPSDRTGVTGALLETLVSPAGRTGVTGIFMEILVAPTPPSTGPVFQGGSLETFYIVQGQNTQGTGY